MIEKKKRGDSFTLYQKMRIIDKGVDSCGYLL